MKLLIILAWAVVASAFPKSELLARNRVMPVQDNIEGRITNGETAAVGQFPYQVALRMGNDVLCSGSVISNTWVLTIAQCVMFASSVEVILGSISLSDPKVTRTATSADIFNHPGFNMVTLQNDIALIRIPYVDYSELIQPVGLPSKDSDYEGEIATVSGWGTLSTASFSFSDYLQYISVPVITNQVCAQSFGPLITEDRICTATSNGQSTCNGDAGAPLVQDNVQIGVVSFGLGSGCELGYPIGLTRVSKFVDWIKSTTGI